MSSTTHLAPERFTACDTIATFYDKLNVPATVRKSPFGCKAYKWNVESSEVSCACGVSTLGPGVLTITPKAASSSPLPHVFKKCSSANLGQAKAYLDTPLTSAPQEVNLSTPNPVKKQEGATKESL